MAILQTAELSKSYRGRRVVNGVSLKVTQGEVVGLLGPNGAGKTTSFHMIVGLIQPDSGQVLLDERDITSLPMYQRARLGISYLPQEPSVFRKLTVEENIMAILQTVKRPREDRRDRLEALIGEMGLETVRKSRGYQLSGGERRRVEIARSLVIAPSFLLLDEPFSGIDPKQVLELQKIISRLKRSGIGILMTDHNVRETLSVTDRAYIIHNGEVFRAGAPRDLESDPEVRRVYLGESFSFEDRPAVHEEETISE
jgi:lipopolysaccharide export system ATP-binding protein